jgi:RNA:NAD 2'-phosphotransferase (TPT1/KptA family)
MILYHGTCDTFAESIRREGLIPKKHPLQQKQVGLAALFTKSVHEHKAIYLTTSLETAKHFAQFRADYERAKSNQIVMFGNYNERIKLSTTIIPNAKPAIVVVDLPPSWKPDIKSDPNTPKADRAYWTTKAIPPSYIQSISHR